jgi:hypothetical protein
MKFFKFTVLVLLVFLIGVSGSQVKKSTGWKSPTFTVDIIGLYSLPIQETKGDNIGEFFSFKNYGTKIGWGGQFNLKFGAGSQGQYRPYISLGYSQFQNSDNSTAYLDTNWIINGYPYKGSSIAKSTPGKSEIFLRIPYIGAGFEYAVTGIDKKKRMWYPYFGVEFLMSVITGTYRQTPINAVLPQFSNLEVSYTIKSDLRVGIGGGIGATVRFGKTAGISFGAKYKLYNLIGKKSDFLLEENKMNLLDKAATDLNTNLSSDRNIGTIELYLGATIFLGKTKK